MDNDYGKLDSEEFPKPDCCNCGHVDHLGSCTLNGGCNHLYNPKALEHVFTPITLHRSVWAMEYEHFINCDDIKVDLDTKKVVLASRHLYALFHEDTERTQKLAEWVNKHLESENNNGE